MRWLLARPTLFRAKKRRSQKKNNPLVLVVACRQAADPGARLNTLAMASCGLPSCSRICQGQFNYCSRAHALEAELLSGGVQADAEPSYEVLQALETLGGGAVPTGLSDGDLARLPRKRVVLLPRRTTRASAGRPADDKSVKVEAGGADCLICLQAFTEGEELVLLPCGSEHTFHEGCVMQWLRQKPTCPACNRGCRSNIPPQR